MAFREFVIRTLLTTAISSMSGVSAGSAGLPLPSGPRETDCGCGQPTRNDGHEQNARTARRIREVRALRRYVAYITVGI